MSLLLCKMLMDFLLYFNTWHFMHRKKKKAKWKKKIKTTILKLLFTVAYNFFPTFSPFFFAAKKVKNKIHQQKKTITHSIKLNAIAFQQYNKFSRNVCNSTKTSPFCVLLVSNIKSTSSVVFSKLRFSRTNLSSALISPVFDSQCSAPYKLVSGSDVCNSSSSYLLETPCPPAGSGLPESRKNTLRISWKHFSVNSETSCSFKLAISIFGRISTLMVPPVNRFFLRS